VLFFDDLCCWPSPLADGSTLSEGDYSSPLTRAKLCEIALALSPVVKDLDFNTADGGQAMQLKAVEVIRKCGWPWDGAMVGTGQIYHPVMKDGYGSAFEKISNSGDLRG
jgi:hypothetical protein